MMGLLRRAKVRRTLRRVIRGQVRPQRSRGALPSALGAAAVLGLTWAAQRLRNARTAGDLRGKVVLITGGSRGLGLALAREFARAGARLAVCARSEEELALAQRDLYSKGAEVLALRCDVTVEEEVSATINQVIGHYGTIDILVNNAGVMNVGPLWSQTADDFERALAVMYWGTVYPTLAVLPHMRARHRGQIVNVTSIGGKVSMPHMLPYSSAKFAAVGFSEGLRAELAREGLGVTTVVPGLMRTGSYVNATYNGNSRAEYKWFSLAANLPLFSMDARRAARMVIAAVRRGDAHVVLSNQAKFLLLLHALFPGFTADLLAGVNRLLPSARAEVPHLALSGRESESGVTRSFLTSLGREARRDLNQN